MSEKIIVDYMERVWKEKKLSVIDEYFHPEVVIHSPLGEFKGPESLKETFQQWLTAFPDLIVTEVQVTAQDDRIIRQWTARGTHQGAFQGIPATGRPVHYMGATAHRVLNGKVVEYWAYVNVARILSQLQQEASV